MEACTCFSVSHFPSCFVFFYVSSHSLCWWMFIHPEQPCDVFRTICLFQTSHCSRFQGAVLCHNDVGCDPDFPLPGPFVPRGVFHVESLSQRSRSLLHLQETNCNPTCRQPVLYSRILWWLPGTLGTHCRCHHWAVGRVPSSSTCSVFCNTLSTAHTLPRLKRLAYRVRHDHNPTKMSVLRCRS